MEGKELLRDLLGVPAVVVVVDVVFGIEGSFVCRGGLFGDIFFAEAVSLVTSLASGTRIASAFAFAFADLFDMNLSEARDCECFSVS